MFAVVGATALSVAACGSSNTAAPTAPAGPTGSTTAQAQAPTRALSPGGTGRVAGLIASVTGNAAQVTQQNGNATVDFTSSTQVTEVTSAALSDVTAGSCVSVRPARGESQGAQSITARSVRVSPAVDGKCQQPPAGSPSSGHRGVGGTVASVAGGTITVNGDDGAAPTTVAVTDKTRYSKRASASTQSIAQGKCMTAQGSLDGSGALQATTINLRPANDGKCPGEGGPHHGHGG
jgi:hypothetical protein